MRKRYKILLYGLASLFLIVLLLLGYVYQNREALKRELLNVINASLKTKVEVGSIGIDFFHNFPKVGLDLKQVAVHDAFGRKQHLLDASHVYIGFDLLDIINKNYRIRQVSIDSASINVLVLKDGRANYNIFKSDTSSTGPFLLDLQEINTKAVAYVYDDRYLKQFHQGTLQDITFAVKMEDELTTINASGDLFIDKARTGKLTLIQSKNINIDGGFSYNSKSGKLLFNTTNIAINELRATLLGQVINGSNYTDMDISFRSKSLTIPDLLSLLPSKKNLGEDWTSDGKVYFSGSVKGRSSKGKEPVIDITFGVDDGTMKNKKTDVKLSDIQCKGQLHNRSGKFILLLHPLSFHINESSFRGELDITSFNDPYIAGKVLCSFQAKDLIKLADLTWCKDADGKIDADIIFAGSVKDFTSKSHSGSATASGNIRVNLDDVELKDADRDIETLVADMTLEPSAIVLNKLNISIDRSDINVTGRLENIFGYMLSDQVLKANIRYHSNYVDLNHFMMPVAGKKTEAGTAEAETPFTFPANIELDADASIDKFIYDAFDASSVKGNIRWQGNHIDVSHASCNAMGGSISISGQLDASADGRYLIGASGTTDKVNITELFRQCKNFGQTELTDKHLKGQMSTKFELASVWSNHWVCDMNKLYVTADITLHNGEINNYEPLQKLSRFVNVDDLRNLRFATLQNRIEIREQVIYIPEMDIVNNALNLTLSGTHTFANYLDYRMRIRLSDLIKKKRKPAENEFGEEEEGGRGLNLFITMKGPVDNIKYEYDMASVKKKIRQDFKKEGANVMNVLKRDLGIGKDTTIKEKKNDNSDELEFEKE